MVYLVKVSQLSDGGDVRLDDLPLSVRGAAAGEIITAEILTDSGVQVRELTPTSSQTGEVLLRLRLGVLILSLAVANPAVTKSQRSQLGLSCHLSLFSSSWPSLCLSLQSISFVREFH